MSAGDLVAQLERAAEAATTRARVLRAKARTIASAIAEAERLLGDPVPEAPPKLSEAAPKAARGRVGYIVNRLARERPDLLAAVERGELTEVRQRPLAFRGPPGPGGTGSPATAVQRPGKAHPAYPHSGVVCADWPAPVVAVQSELDRLEHQMAVAEVDQLPALAARERELAGRLEALKRAAMSGTSLATGNSQQHAIA